MAAAVTGAELRGGARRHIEPEHEREGKDVSEDQKLSRSTMEWSGEAGEAGRRRSHARTRRPEAGENGRRRRIPASRLDSLAGELEDDETELMATSVGFGAAGINGLHDSGGGQ